MSVSPEIARLAGTRAYLLSTATYEFGLLKTSAFPPKESGRIGIKLLFVCCCQDLPIVERHCNKFLKHLNF